MNNLQTLLNLAKQQVLRARTEPERFRWLWIQGTIEGLLKRQTVTMSISSDEQNIKSVVK